MKVDIILDADKEIVERFVEEMRHRAVISRTKGTATIELRLVSPSMEDLEEVINSSLLNTLIVEFPEFDLNIELKKQISATAVGAISLRELIEFVGYSFESLMLLLKYLTIRGDKVKFHPDAGKRALLYFLTNPCKFYKLIGEKLKTHYVKLFDILVNMLISGTIPLNQAWKLAYIVAYKGLGEKRIHIIDFFSSLIDYLQRVDSVDSIMSWILITKANHQLEDLTLQLDFDALLMESKKKGTLVSHVAAAVTSLFLYGRKIHGLTIIKLINENLEKLIRDALTLKNENVLCDLFVSGLLGAVTPFIGCDLLKELFNEEPTIEKFDYWGCFSVSGFNLEEMLYLGSPSYVLYKRLVGHRNPDKLVHYTNNYLDWYLVDLVITNFNEKVKKFMEKILEEVRTAIINIPSRLDLEGNLQYLRGITDRLFGTTEARDEIIRILSDMTKEKEGVAALARFLLSQEKTKLVENEENPKLLKILENLPLLKQDAKYKIIKFILENDELSKSWEFYVSRIIYEILKDLNDHELITDCIGNKYVQKEILNTVEDALEFIKIKMKPIPVTPENAEISIILNYVGDKLEYIVRILGSEPISIMQNIWKNLYEVSFWKFIRNNVKGFVNGIGEALRKLEIHSSGIEQNASFAILSKGKANKLQDISVGTITPMRIIICNKDECEEYPIEQRNKFEIYIENDKLEESISKLKTCIERINQHVFEGED